MTSADGRARSRKADIWRWGRHLIFFLALLPFVWMVIGVIQNSLGADPARTLALDSGRWSLRFLLASLAITPCREIFKVSALAPLRRTLGLFSLFYASVHLLVYIVFLLEMRWSEIGSDILERPYITVGFTAFLILAALGATSPKFMVRRLGRRWKFLHRFVYLAVVLAVVHLTWILRTDLSDAVLYGSIAAVLLLYRVAGVIRRHIPR
ncbi:MAG: protein-methionine-sulfoxide reductase heme-binding subunit MsrQ [Pseudohongiella sp.]|nr:protein-methionine-sulfoxide reductase heme-binding subunit MsrQ [Pseudohongiella sp.]